MNDELPNHDELLDDTQYRRDVAREERETWEEEMNEADDECRPESWED